MLFIHLAFTHWNAKKNYRPFYRWMKLTMELPADGHALTEIDHKVFGLPPEENKRFWAAEDKFNNIFIRLLNVYCVLTWPVFDLQLFMVKFPQVEMAVYIAAQTINVAHGLFIIWHFFHIVYTLACFFIQCMWFLCQKFRHISKKVGYLRKTKSKLIHNQRLAKLIRDYNEVLAEVVDINDFFKGFLGHNLLHFGGIAVFQTFLRRKKTLLFKLLDA